MYCYLRARFGKPNGITSLILKKKNTSDNYIHWDFHLKSGSQNIYIMGFSKEFQIKLYEATSDQNWLKLIDNIKKDFGRVAREKSDFFRTLEKWAIFPNKYVQIANVCADLHSSIADGMEAYASFRKSSYTTEKERRIQHKEMERIHARATEIHDKHPVAQFPQFAVPKI